MWIAAQECPPGLALRRRELRPRALVVSSTCRSRRRLTQAPPDAHPVITRWRKKKPNPDFAVKLRHRPTQWRHRPRGAVAEDNYEGRPGVERHYNLASKCAAPALRAPHFPTSIEFGWNLNELPLVRRSGIDNYCQKTDRHLQQILWAVRNIRVEEH